MTFTKLSLMNKSEFRIPKSQILLLLFLFTGMINAGDWSGSISAEGRIFPEDPLFEEQHGSSYSFAAQPEFYHDWARGDQSILFIPFGRYDGGDELSLIHISEPTRPY